MAYLLDTNVLSEFRKPKNCNAGVAAWFAGVAADEVFVSVLTLGEIRRGAELRRSRDPEAARHLERWLSGLELHYSDRILPITSRVADRWGRLCLSQPLPVVDGLLAASALEHNLTLVTRNIQDTARSGVNCINPFTPADGSSSGH